MSRKKPLELIFRHNGLVELVDANDNTIFSSDGDADFKDAFSDEFLGEDDMDDVLDYLVNREIISQAEMDYFESGAWDCTLESLDGSILEDDIDEDETDITDLDEDD